MKPPAKNWIEWTVFALGCVIVATVVSYLVWDIVRHEQQPPVVRVQLGEVRPQGAGFAVAVTAINEGTQVAEGVVVEVTLSGEGGEERGEVQFPFLPRGSRAHGWVVLPRDPRTGRLAARVLGYHAP